MSFGLMLERGQLSPQSVKGASLSVPPRDQNF